MTHSVHILRSIILLPLLLASPEIVYSSQSTAPAHYDRGVVIPDMATHTIATSDVLPDSITSQAVTVNITETARLETSVLPVDVFVDGSLA